MNKEIRDEDLRQALIDYYDTVTAALPNPQELHYNYSPLHLARMEHLIRSRERRNRRVFTLQRVAVILLALLLTFGSWLAVDVHAREVFFTWVRTVYEDHVVYRFHGGASTTTGELPDYVLGWIPEGFELVEEDKNSKIYENQLTGYAIVFDYSIQSELVQVSDYKDVDTIVIDQLEGEYYSAKDEDDSNEFMWFDDKHGIVFHINSTLNKDEIIKMAHSVKIISQIIHEQGFK